MINNNSQIIQNSSRYPMQACKCQTNAQAHTGGNALTTYYVLSTSQLCTNKCITITIFNQAYTASHCQSPQPLLVWPIKPSVLLDMAPPALDPHDPPVAVLLRLHLIKLFSTQASNPNSFLYANSSSSVLLLMYPAYSILENLRKKRPNPKPNRKSLTIVSQLEATKPRLIPK